MKYIYFVLIIIFSLVNQQSIAQDQPDRAILLIIDGLHTQAPERLNMPNFNRLAGQGTLIEKTCGIMPYHPTTGEYAEVHTSSYPNPVMMAGTVFLKPDQEMLQHSFENTAFIANTSAYQSITDGYQFVVQKGDSDAFAVDQAIEMLDQQKLDFIRVHLQNAGGAGYQSFSAENDHPFKHNIWYQESPYTQALEEADRQLGRFISELKRIGKWQSTLLVVTSDHGQTKTGWHPTLPQESWLFPTIFYGPNINQNKTLEWADQIDLIPTIAHLMNVPAPNDDGGSGRILYELIESNNDTAYSSRLLALNEILARYIRTEAEMLVNSEEYPYLNSSVMIFERDFYGLDRIMDWHEMQSIDSLINHNEQIVEEMKSELEDLE